jgi:hypothetical protein
VKTIGDFVESKIRRSGSEEVLTFERGGGPHAELGGFEGTLYGPKGQVAFFERGMVLGDGTAIAWENIERAVKAGERVELHLSGDTVQALDSSRWGAEVVYATLRWVGNALLRRKIAE